MPPRAAGRRRPAAPPALVWIAALLLALVAVAATIPGYLARRPDVAWWRFYGERITGWAAAARDDGALRVAAIGGSMLGRATFWDEAMEAFAKDEAGLDLDFLRVVRRGGQIDRVTPLLDPLLEAGPDVVLWHAGGLADPDPDAALHRAYQQPGSGPPVESWRRAFAGDGIYRHQAHVFQVALGPFGELDAVVNPARRVAFRREFFVCRPNLTKRRLRIHAAMDPDDYAVVPPLVRATMETFLDRAARHGVRVVFLDVPMHESLETMPAPAMRRRVVQAEIDRFVAEGRAESWTYPERLDESDFCELRHMSEQGRDAYSTWLVGRLVDFRRAHPR
ncbi:MAG TPA: hypothetical protein VKB65_10430 [Myxococcota bacterium]|nr:hypothetical protein [Myxococcota bacterium]